MLNFSDPVIGDVHIHSFSGVTYFEGNMLLIAFFSVLKTDLLSEVKKFRKPSKLVLELQAKHVLLLVVPKG